MGRKSKQTAKKSSGKENSRFVLQKRKELTILVDKLLRLTTVFQSSTNAAKSWEHHLEIDAIVKEITNLECSQIKSSQKHRQNNLNSFTKWLKENDVFFEGIEVAEFKGYDLGLKATKDLTEGSLILSVPLKVMMTEKNAKESCLEPLITVDPLLKSMPNITLALFLLLEKSNPESFWKPYIDTLPEKYTTILYYNTDELEDLRPSPVYDSSLKLYRSIARQYAYFYGKLHNPDLPDLKKLQEIFTFDNYRWAVSTVMTRQNNIRLGEDNVTAFIPLWDMCNHEQGKITTDFDKDHSECYALRDFKAGEQIFIYYGARSNADLLLHNGFVYENNINDSLTLSLGISAVDPLCQTRIAILNKLGLAAVTHYNLYQDYPVSAELLAFIRIFSMNEEELSKWVKRMPGDLVARDMLSFQAVGAQIDDRAYTYLLTRCKLLLAAYQKAGEVKPDNLHRKNIKLLKDCEVQILESAIRYLTVTIQQLPTANQK